MGLSPRLGELLVREARRLIERHLLTGERGLIEPLEGLDQRRGAFVTLALLEGNERVLRGCMGVPEPLYPLHQAVSIAALSACRDPRFEPLRPEEMERVLVEVSVLSPFRPLTGRPLSYPSMIKVGLDGLFVSYGPLQGLLLPQVAVEEGWDAEELLCNACLKAGLPPDAWLAGAKVYAFRADVFGEELPRGPVRRLLGSEEEEVSESL
jgi:uncharacterized protein (TIGR00296 family)